MRLLLDECVPRTLLRDLAEYEPSHVGDLGWKGKENGELISLMRRAGFTCLLTVDQNLSYQQNLLQAGVIVALLLVRSNRRDDILPRLGELRKKLAFARPGDLIRIGVE